MWQVDVGGRGPGRRRLWHVTGINSVDRGEVVDVLVKDRGLDQGRQGRPGSSQDRVEVTEGLFCLRLDALRDNTRDRVDASRPGAEDESVGDDRLAVRTKGGRRRVRGHCL